MLASVVNINDVLDGHVVLDLECLDRIYLNAYVPNLQVGGQVVTYLTRHLGHEIPSPALFKKIGDHFRADVKAFAEANAIPVLRLKRPDRTRWDDRKLDHLRPHLERAEREARSSVVAIVAAQEIQKVFMGYASGKGEHGRAVNFGFDKADRAVTVYYFYIYDNDFGPGFIKLCTYFPYPGKVWLNGHEWVKRQADKQRVAYTELANGFATAERPEKLQAICDRLGPRQIQAFFDRWMAKIPTPLGRRDRAGGYWWELSMRQVEVSRTICFDDPRRARGFFEALVGDNVGIGRPEQVAVVFARQVRKTTKEPFRTRIFGPGTEVKMDFSYKHSRVKQYLKEGRSLRIETVINKPYDIGVLARLEHLPELQAKARGVNRRLTYDRACRSGLCHRRRSVRAPPTVLRKGGPTNRSVSLRGSTRHGPGRCSLCVRPRRRRLHEQEPPEPRRRVARHGLHAIAHELRPAAPPPSWPCPNASPDPTPMSSRLKEPGWLSSTASSTPGFCDLCWQRTHLQHLLSFVAPLQPSIAPSADTSRTPASEPRHETCHVVSSPNPQEDLATVRDVKGS